MRTMTMTLALLLSFAGAARSADAPEPSSRAASPAPSWVGYRGPGGYGIYPDAKPPTVFTEKDIAWRVTLPEKGWGHGSPIVVGELVILGVEFNERHNIFPSLVAFNTADGSVAWSTVLDHLPAVDVSDEEREKIRAEWKRICDYRVQRSELARRYRTAKTEEDKAAIKGEAEAAGLVIGKGKRGGIDVQPKDRKHFEGAWRWAHKGGFSQDTWRGYNMGTSYNVGHMFGTPVSDLPAVSATQPAYIASRSDAGRSLQAGGTHIWAHTSFNGIFCVDLQGKIVWSAYVPGLVKYSHNEFDYCKAGRSPILWKDPAGGPTLLLSDIGDTVRAIDAGTGKLLWKDDLDHKKNHTYTTPGVLRVGETEVLWSAGCNAYRLPDGKKLTIEGWNTADYGTQSLVKHDERDVLFLAGAGEHSGWTGKGGGPNPSPAAIRWTLEGDVLKANVLWNAKDLAGNGAMGGSAMLYDEGKFYHNNGGIYDALTGKQLTPPRRDRYDKASVPKTRHLRLLAGGHVYGVDRAKGSMTMTVHAADGTYVGTSTLPGNSYGCSYTFGSAAIYLRTDSELVCIADYLQGRPQDDPKVVARIQAATTLDELTPFVSHDSPLYRLEALRRLNGLVQDGKITVPENITQTLDDLARKDPYHPIAAQAMRLLGLRVGEPGYALMVERIGRSWHNPKNPRPMNAASQGLESLGEVGIDALLAIMADGKLDTKDAKLYLDASLRLKAAAAYRDMLHRPASARDRLISAIRSEDVDPATRAVIVYALTQSHPGDEAVVACMREQLTVEIKWPRTRLRHPHSLAKAYIETSTTE